MKWIFLTLLILSLSYLAKAQQSGSFKISEIGWTFTPSSDYILIDSSAKDYRLPNNLSVWRKNLIFKNDKILKTTIACSIMSDIKSEEEWSQMRPIEVERSYESLTKQKANLQFDSSTSILKIGGIEFNKFSMHGKENGQVKYFNVQLSKFYKGYRVVYVYISNDPLMEGEIEKQLISSKFD